MKNRRDIVVGFASVNAVVFAIVATFGLFLRSAEAGCTLMGCINCTKNAATGLCDGDKRLKLCMTDEVDCSTCKCDYTPDHTACGCMQK